MRYLRATTASPAKQSATHSLRCNGGFCLVSKICVCRNNHWTQQTALNIRQNNRTRRTQVKSLQALLSRLNHLSKYFTFWQLDAVKHGICYENICPVRLSVCHTRESSLNGSRYRNRPYALHHSIE